VQSLADAEHREALHHEGAERSMVVAQQTAMLIDMLKQNTDLTDKVRALTERVEALTLEMHQIVCARTTR
jgi:hypothetical protein